MPTQGIKQGFAKLQQHYQQCYPQHDNQLARVQLRMWPEKGHLFDQEMQQQVVQWLLQSHSAEACVGQ
jgi:hypothetical protein